MGVTENGPELAEITDEDGEPIPEGLAPNDLVVVHGSKTAIQTFHRRDHDADGIESACDVPAHGFRTPHYRKLAELRPCKRDACFGGAEDGRTDSDGPVCGHELENRDGTCEHSVAVEGMYCHNHIG